MVLAHRGCVMAWAISSDTFWTVKIKASIKEHREYWCWECPSLFEHSVPILTFSRTTHHVTKLKSQTGFLDMTISSHYVTRPQFKRARLLCSKAWNMQHRLAADKFVASLHGIISILTQISEKHLWYLYLSIKIGSPDRYYHNISYKVAGECMVRLCRQFLLQLLDSVLNCRSFVSLPN